MRNRREEEEEVGEVGEETWQGGRELYLTISHYSYWSDKNRNNETDLKYLNERSDTYLLVVCYHIRRGGTKVSAKITCDV